MTKTLGRGPARSQRTLIVLAVVALLASLITVYVPAPAQADSHTANQAGYWEDQYPEASECIKYGATGSNEHGSSDGTAVTLNSGFEFVALIVKGGNVDHGYGPGNAVYENPVAGTAYYAPQNAGGQVAQVSHWIVCVGEEEPDEASVVVGGECVEEDFVISITVVNATVDIDLDGDGVLDSGETNLGSGDYEFTGDDENWIPWEATAEDGAEFDDGKTTRSGEIYIEECEEDFLASVDVSGQCVDEEFVVTVTAEHATVSIDLNGDGDFDDSGESGLTGGSHVVTAAAGETIDWHAFADEDAEFDEDIDDIEGELTVEDCEEEPELAEVDVDGECRDEDQPPFEVTVDVDNATVSIDLDGDGAFEAGETGLTSGTYVVTAPPGTDIAWEASADAGAEFGSSEETSGTIEVDQCAEVLASVVVTVGGTCVLTGDTGQGVITVTIPVDGAATVVITDAADNEIATLTKSGTVDVPEGATYSWAATANEGFEFPPDFTPSGEVDIVECSEPEVQASVTVTVSGACLVVGSEGQGRITVNMSVDGAATVVITDADDNVIATLTEPGTVTVDEGATYSWAATANEGFEFPVDFDPSGDVVIATCSQPEELPFTGIDSEPLVAIAATLLGLGAVLITKTRRREEF